MDGGAMNRPILAFLCLWVGAAALHAETLVTEAKVLEVTDRGFVLSVGTEPLAVEDSVQTRFWKDCGPIKKDAFAKGDMVFARIKTDTDPPLLRELADPVTWKWLEKIRHEYVKGTVEKVEAKRLLLKLEDGKNFSYSISEKSAAKIKDKPDMTVMRLEAGTQVWAKGRLLSNLDTWLVEVTDVKPPDKPSKSPKEPAKKTDPLPDAGTLSGMITGHLEALRMFDLVSGVRALHISYNASTKFTFEGKPGKPSQLKSGQKCIVEYRRDKAGRILALKVEIELPGA